MQSLANFKINTHLHTVHYNVVMPKFTCNIYNWLTIYLDKIVKIFNITQLSVIGHTIIIIIIGLLVLDIILKQLKLYYLKQFSFR